MGIYSSIVKNPLNKLDQKAGSVFRNLFYFTFKFSAIGISIYGAFLLVSGLFGKTGYFSMLRTLETFDLIRSIICFGITFLISAFTFYAIAAILWKRANDFKTREFSGAVFLFPRFIKIIGEAMAVIPMSAALISFFAIVLSAIPYAPIESLGHLMGGAGSSIINEFVGNTFSAIFIDTINDYFKLLFEGGFVGLIGGFLISLGILFGTYIVAEIFEMFIYFLIRKPLYK